MSAGITIATVISASIQLKEKRIAVTSDHRQSLDRELRESVLEQLLQHLDVTRHPGHDHARLLVGEVVERQTLDVRVDPDPQVVHDLRSELPGVADPAALDEHREQHRDEVDDAAEDDDVEVRACRRGRRRCRSGSGRARSGIRRLDVNRSTDQSAIRQRPSIMLRQTSAPVIR